MVSYKITSPVKQGQKDGKPFLVVDIIQYVGNSPIRCCTLPKEVVDRFIKAVFGEDFEPSTKTKKQLGERTQ